jgi:hypothetical protein
VDDAPDDELPLQPTTTAVQPSPPSRIAPYNRATVSFDLTLLRPRIVAVSYPQLPSCRAVALVGDTLSFSSKSHSVVDGERAEVVELAATGVRADMCVASLQAVRSGASGARTTTLSQARPLLAEVNAKVSMTSQLLYPLHNRPVPPPSTSLVNVDVARLEVRAGRRCADVIQRFVGDLNDALARLQAAQGQRRAAQSAGRSRLAPCCRVSFLRCNRRGCVVSRCAVWSQTRLRRQRLVK